MKKMKCSSCGGNLNIDANNEYGTCNYCGTKYKLKEDINVNIKLDENVKETFNEGMNQIGKFSRISAVPASIITFIIIAIIVIITIKMYNMNKSTPVNDYNQTSNEKFDEIYEETKEIFENIYNQENKDMFNIEYEMYSGTQQKFFINMLLNKVTANNQKNKNQLIEVVFEDKNTTDVNEILNIENSLQDKQYNVLFEYDEQGYINKLIIK